MNLRILRESRNISQKKLADQVNISQQAIYKYENALAEPNIEMLIQFADFFHVSVDYLIGYTEDGYCEKTVSDSVPDMTPMEVHHLVQYRKLPKRMQKHYDEILDALVRE